MNEPDNLAECADGVPRPDPASRTGQFTGFFRSLARRTRLRNFLILAAAASVVFTVWMSRGWLAGVDWQDLGYPGVFLTSFLGSVSMVLPVPGLLTLCGVSVILSPVLVGIVAGVGEAIGELSGYAVGYGGKAVIENRSFYRRVRVWMARRGALIIFAFSVIPNPVVDVVGIAAGATRFPLMQFFGIVLAGKVLKGILVAYLCYFGIRLLPWIG